MIRFEIQALNALGQNKMNSLLGYYHFINTVNDQNLNDRNLNNAEIQTKMSPIPRHYLPTSTSEFVPLAYYVLLYTYI